jgi:hypothetical protein
MPRKVTLRNKETGETSEHYTVDAKTILDSENSIYALASGKLKGHRASIGGEAAADASTGDDEKPKNNKRAKGASAPSVET